LLAHVTDGSVACNFDKLKLPESEEMKADRAYLENTAGILRAQGLAVTAHLARGDPPRGISRTAEAEPCDLIAMTSHRHRLLGDFLLVTTIHEVRHRTSIPVLLARAGPKDRTG